jgi:hypothetical protein
MQRPLPSLRLPVGARYHIEVASQLQVLHIVDIPLTDVGPVVVDIGSEFAKEESERHG